MEASGAALEMLVDVGKGVDIADDDADDVADYVQIVHYLCFALFVDNQEVEMEVNVFLNPFLFLFYFCTVCYTFDLL